MKILIIAEKPDMCKKIYTALSKGNLKHNGGYHEDDEFIFTNAVGHLLRLAYPKEVDSKYSQRNISNLPFAFSNIPLVVTKETSVQFGIVKKLLARSDVGEVINACDSDREGEYIYRNIILGSKVKFKAGTKFTRLWLSSTTKEGIVEAFNDRKSSSEYNLLGQSAKGRSYADYHIGLNATIAMTSLFGKNKEIISVGRVQTPTLKIIVDRELEILNFQSKKLYSLYGSFTTAYDEKFTGEYIPTEQDKNEFLEASKAKETANSIKRGPYKVIEVKEQKKNTSHKSLFSLSDLQVLLSAKYGYSAQEVLDTVQDLYEKHSLVTYPRTDEIHVSPEWAKKLSSVVLNSISEVFGKIIEEIKNNGYTFDSKCIAPKDKIGAHEALTPTEKKITVSEYKALTEKEKNVYVAIVRRFLSCFYNDAVDLVIAYKMSNGTDTFKYGFTKELEKGYRVVEKSVDTGANQDEEKEKPVELKQGQIVNLHDVIVKERTTQPPKRFSEGSLIKEMKNPAKYLENKEDKDLIKSVEGIGTEATRASIIESLKKRNYIETKSKHIVPTEKGMNFIKIFPSEIVKSVELTVDFERKLEKIAEGELSFNDFLNYVYDFDKQMISDIEEAKKTQNIDLSSGDNVMCKCPYCGGDIVEYKNCYACKNKDCNTVIFKDQLKILGLKKITSKQAIELFTKGITSSKAKGFVNKSGSKYTAYLTYSKNKEDKFPNRVWITFENPNATKTKKTFKKTKKFTKRK